MHPVLKIDGLWKTYQGGDVEVHAVRGVSIEVQAGEFVAIMGASGSGKSTMMNIVGCLDRPTQGTYLLDGIDVSHLGRDARADIRNAKIGFVFQGFNLLSRTSALENVELPMMYDRKHHISAKTLRQNAMDALTLVGLAKRFDHHPNQLSGRASNNASPSPGGSSINRPFCSRMSRRGTSIAGRASRSWKSSNV